MYRGGLCFNGPYSQENQGNSGKRGPIQLYTRKVKKFILLDARNHWPIRLRSLTFCVFEFKVDRKGWK